jgi:AraC-like DNA-binding protein
MPGMSRSALHHRFRTLTAMSPLQFQKQLRLRAARQRMLRGELDAASAAFEVGYESPSQFNREYRRFLGRPAIRDIKALRDGKVVAITTALTRNCWVAMRQLVLDYRKQLLEIVQASGGAFEAHKPITW